MVTALAVAPHLHCCGKWRVRPTCPPSAPSAPSKIKSPPRTPLNNRCAAPSPPQQQADVQLYYSRRSSNLLSLGERRATANGLYRRQQNKHCCGKWCVCPRPPSSSPAAPSAPRTSAQQPLRGITTAAAAPRVLTPPCWAHPPQQNQDLHTQATDILKV